MSERARWVIVAAIVFIVAIMLIRECLFRMQSAQKVQEVATVNSMPKSVQSPKANDMKSIDLAKPGNQPYRPARMELFQPESTFEIVGTDVTPGTQLHWVFVNRMGEHGMIFRALLGDSRAFGPIGRGRIVRLGQVYFWSNPGHEGNIVVVLAIE